MILIDVNVLIYAFRESAPEHSVYAKWLGETLGGTEQVVIPDTVLTGFLRIVTNPRVLDPPASMSTALAFVNVLRRLALPVENSAAVWDQFVALVGTDQQIRANLVPDCYLAAVALTHKARVATRERGFARFPGVRSFDPAAHS